MKNLKHELENIKENGRSFLGIDGGDIHSGVWFCGIEFGDTIDNQSKYIDKYVEYKEGIPYRTKCPKKYLRSNYDRYLSVMYINLFKAEIFQDVIDTKLIEKVLKEEIYNENSEIFKLNLYPLAKKNTDWDISIEKKFNISRDEYYGGYFDKRKQFFQELVKEFHPTKIICTAVKNSESQFVEAFLKNDLKIEYRWEYLSIRNNLEKKKIFKISEYRQGNISLLIIPFPGMGKGNLNSYDDVIFIANHLRSNYF